MSNIKVASRYAKALLELAIEKNALEAVIGDMKGLLSIAEQNREVGLALNSPIVTYDKKFNILIEVCIERYFSKSFSVTITIPQIGHFSPI
jgi:F-type H+-transporting ATPase subunit delta